MHWSCAAAVSELPWVKAYAAAGLSSNAQNNTDGQQDKQHTALQALHYLTGQSTPQACT